MWRKYTSLEDASVNWTRRTPDGGLLETRFVQRDPGYWITYLSSHSGCRYACRFCHLTATRQVMMSPASIGDYLDQAMVVWDHYRGLVAGRGMAERKLHFNFMARGEPLSNPVILTEAGRLFDSLGRAPESSGLDVRFNISSIIPEDFPGRLDMILKDPRSALYYSLYTTSNTFRRRWLPRAMAPERALDLIADYQVRTGRGIVLHWALIAGQNDDLDDLERTLEAVNARGIQARFNLVRYNPHDARHGIEASDERINEVFARINESLPDPANRIVPRVGYDVKASCGMFVGM